MPIGSFPSVGAKINAEDLSSRIDKIETYVNKGIDSKVDFKDDGEGQFSSKHVYKPDLFGSPSPRMMAVSSQIHWRNTDLDWTDGVLMLAGAVGNAWTPVPGLCTRIKLAQKADVYFMSSFYCFEMGGVTDSHAAWEYSRKKEGATEMVTTRTDKLDRKSFGHEYEIAAGVRLMVDGTTQGSTHRNIFTSNVYPTQWMNVVINGGHIMFQMVSRHQQSICKTLSLSAGVHDIGIVCRPEPLDLISLSGFAKSAEHDWEHEHKHVYFLSRTMVVDCNYIDD